MWKLGLYVFSTRPFTALLIARFLSWTNYPSTLRTLFHEDICTPLHTAVGWDALMIAEVLIAHGANVNAERPFVEYIAKHTR